MFPSKCNILVWNWFDTMGVLSALQLRGATAPGLQWPQCWSDTHVSPVVCGLMRSYALFNQRLISFHMSWGWTCLGWDNFNFIMCHFWHNNTLYEICFPCCGDKYPIDILAIKHFEAWQRNLSPKILFLKTTTNSLEFFPFHVIDIHASLIQYPICLSKSYFDEELCFCITNVLYLAAYHGVERVSVEMISTSSCVIYNMIIYCMKYVSHIDKNPADTPAI